MLDRLDRYLGPIERALNLRARRSEVLASNIANSDTPNYQARDFDFRAAFDHAKSARQSVGLSRTDADHINGRITATAPVGLQYRMPLQSSIDNNTVEVDVELAQFSDNAIHYQADLAFMNSRVRTLMSAIQGQ
jgi:flagellar basal-body rod protein FlgB